MLDKKSISCKQENPHTIIRVVHNRENPFVQLNRNALWDKRLSMKATGLWARCLSMPSDWKFTMKQLIEHSKEGKVAVYSAMKELIEHGYALRLEISDRSNGKFTSSRLEYVFFEFAATKEEIDEQIEIFKKSLPHAENRDTGNRDTGNQPLLIIKTLTEKKDLSKKKQLSPIPLSSEPQEPDGSMPTEAGEKRVASSKAKKGEKPHYPVEVTTTGEAMIRTLTKAKPDCKPPSLPKFYNSIDLMIRIDKRSPERIVKLFEWALADEFWKDKFFKPNPADYLRGKFDQLDAKMSAPPPRTGAQIDKRRRDENGDVTDAWKDELF